MNGPERLLKPRTSSIGPRGTYCPPFPSWLPLPISLSRSATIQRPQAPALTFFTLLKLCGMVRKPSFNVDIPRLASEYLQVFNRSDRISSLSLFTVIQISLALSLLFFLTFHSESMRDPLNLPPKRLFVTPFVPSAWLDDALIAERKTGLTTYLCGLLASKFKHSEVLAEFLSPDSKEYPCFFDMEGALPSTLFRKAALTSTQEVSTAAAAMIAAAYYPSWSASTTPPEKLDFSKFDLIPSSVDHC